MVCQDGMVECIPAGETTTATTCGEARDGTTAQYLMVMFEPTGKAWHDTGRHQQNWGTTGSYRQGAETRRDFRGFGQETRYQQAPVATRQGPVGTKAQQAPVATRQGPDLSKNKSAFAGVERGSDVRIQSNRGLQSRQSMSSKGTGGVSKGNVGKGNVGRPR